MTRHFLSILVPVHNEEKTLLELVQKIEMAMNETLPHFLYEIVIIENSSQDGTRRILKEQISQYPFCKIFINDDIKGKGAAIRYGIKKLQGAYTIIQDADLEYSPFDYQKLLIPLIENHADVVYGSRYLGEKSFFVKWIYWHTLINHFLTFLSNMFSGMWLSDMETCYKAFKTPLLSSLFLTSNHFEIEPEITAKLARLKKKKLLTITEVPISYKKRSYQDGKKIRPIDGILAVWAIFKFNILKSS